MSGREAPSVCRVIDEFMIPICDEKRTIPACEDCHLSYGHRRQQAAEMKREKLNAAKAAAAEAAKKLVEEELSVDD